MQISKLPPMGIRLYADSIGGWNNIVSGAFSGGVVDSSREEFNASLSIWELGDLRLIHVAAQPSSVSRWMYSTPQKERGTVLLHLQATGRSLNEQLGRTVELAPGESTLCSADLRYRVEFPISYRMFVLELPVANILVRNPDFDLASMAGQRLNSLRSRLLLGFLRTACTEHEAMRNDADWRDCVSRTTFDLAMGAIGQSCEPPLSGATAKLRRDVINYIRAHLCDPDLRTSTVAEALSISARTVQTVFERLATTAGDFITEHRLRHAADLLRTAQNGRSITDIAYACGFSDSAYFSRCFSRHYGLSPRHYRELTKASPVDPMLVGRRSSQRSCPPS